MTGPHRSAGGASAAASSELDPLEKRIIPHLFELQPGYAVFLGLHQYDGRLPDLSRTSTDRWANGARDLLGQLRSLPRDGLPPGRRLDAILLQLLLESPLFDLEEGRDLERNPMSYIGPISLTSYMVRDYAPAEARVGAMIRTIASVPALLEAGERRLESRLPDPFLRLAVAMGASMPSHLQEAEEFARRHSTALGERVRDVRLAAEAAITGFVHRLNTEYAPRATHDFALGPAKYQKLLWVREGIETPFLEVLRSGRSDLDRNQRRLAEIAQAAHPALPPAEAVRSSLEALYREHATAAGLVPYAQGLVEETRAFVTAHDIATIPQPANCRVEETPVYGRALSTASMNPPGPFDVGGEEGIYYVTPVDPTWTPDRQEQWLRALNNEMLRNITAHEVFPGHYLQFLHFRHAAGSFTRKVYLSSSFAEGWAHYAEQLVIEQGLGAGRPDAEIAQLHDALLRDCRLIASVGLHTQGWSLAQATELFQTEAHFEALPAEREAIRGTFNPEYFCYTLGKLAILEARGKYLAEDFHGSLRGFHDALLGFGCPPIGMLEALFEGRRN
jgi:uncharacterized protein (DUF885 family)